MYKHHLQELAQRSCFNLHTYTCMREGPDHAPRFKATVNLNGETFESPNYCSTLLQAEQAAAEVALNSLSNRGPFDPDKIRATIGTSHQHAPAQVTSQAPQGHSQMQNQAEFPSSVSAAPASLLPQPPSSTSSQRVMPLPGIITESSDLSIVTRDPITPSQTKKTKKKSTRKKNPRPIVKYPVEDSYKWRQYWTKWVTSGGDERVCYRCAHPECIAMKDVQFSRDSQKTETIYWGLHNHQPPQGSAELTKDGHTGNLNKSEGVPAAYTLSLKDQEASQVTTGNMSGPGESDVEDEDEPETDER